MEYPTRPLNTPLQAVMSGTVVDHIEHNPTYGGALILQLNTPGVYTYALYGHINSTQLKVGEEVKAGEVVALWERIFRRTV